MNGSRLAVIDASIAVKWVLRESGDHLALELLEAYGAKTVGLIAPALLMQEVASAISKRCRRRELTSQQAREAYQSFQARRPELIDPTSYVTQAFDLSLAHQVSFWDAIYLAIAIDKSADLITADRRFHRSVSRYYPFTILLAE